MLAGSGGGSAILLSVFERLKRAGWTVRAAGSIIEENSVSLPSGCLTGKRSPLGMKQFARTWGTMGAGLSRRRQSIFAGIYRLSSRL